MKGIGKVFLGLVLVEAVFVLEEQFAVRQENAGDVSSGTVGEHQRVIRVIVNQSELLMRKFVEDVLDGLDGFELDSTPPATKGAGVVDMRCEAMFQVLDIFVHNSITFIDLTCMLSRRRWVSPSL